jgi:hypothetical protein
MNAPIKLTNLSILLSFAVCTCASPASPQRNADLERRAPDATNRWELNYSTRTTLSANSAGQPAITFPAAAGSANMLTKPWTGSEPGMTLLVTVEVQTTGTPVFQLAQGPEPTCRTPPSTRPYLEAVGWTSMPPGYSSMRWWSRQGLIPLGAAGVFSIEIPLTPDRWSGVSGQFATQDASSVSWFNQIVTGRVASRAGLVFGGGCSYGHGLYVSGGSATLTVTQFEAR